MKPFDQSEVSRRFKQLPEAVQDVGLSDALQAAFTQSVLNTGLVGEKAIECSQQITLVLVGLSHTEDLEDYVKNDLKFDEAKASAFMSTLRTGVIGPMRQALVTALEQKNTADVPIPVSDAPAVVKSTTVDTNKSIDAVPEEPVTPVAPFDPYHENL
jgi:hypothetical protein